MLLTVPDPLSVSAFDAGACVSDEGSIAVFARVTLDIVDGAVKHAKGALACLSLDVGVLLFADGHTRAASVVGA